MADGRTIWYSEDVAYVRRGLVVVLGQECGSDALAILWVLRAEAKLQNNGGIVLAGYATIARDSFVKDHKVARTVIERAAELGVLDDHETLPDGHRFRCRVSGWSSDQDRGSAAWRQAKLREGKQNSSNGESRPVTVGHASHEDRTGQDRRKDDSLRSSSVSDDHDGHDDGNAASHPASQQPKPDGASPAATPAEAPLCHLLADLIVANGGRRRRIGKKWVDAERLMLRRDGRDPAEAERLIRWCQADEFERANILSMPKFRERYDSLRLKAQRKPRAVDERRVPSSAQLVNARTA